MVMGFSNYLSLQRVGFLKGEWILLLRGIGFLAGRLRLLIQPEQTGLQPSALLLSELPCGFAFFLGHFFNILNQVFSQALVNRERDAPAWYVAGCDQ